MYQRTKSTSRRKFVKDLAIASGAMGFGLSFRATASAAKTSTTDLVKKLDSQVVPSPHESSGVIFEQSGVTHLIFKAIQTDDGQEDEGTAVIELGGCCAMAISYPDADLFSQPGRPRFFSELDSAAIYELENSSWIAALDEKCRHMRPVETHRVKVPLKKVSKSGKITFTSKSMSVTVPNVAYHKPSEDARHFAFTFRRTTFHCVADELKVDFLMAPLGLVLASLSV